MPTDAPLVLPFTDPRCQEVELTGGKGASLATMTAEGLPVPPGFVITSAAFAAAVDEEALREAMRRKDVEAAREKALEFAREWEPTRERLTAYLADHAANGSRVAVYGGGCRSCSLINYTGIGPHIATIVDDQPEKQDKLMPGSRLPIRPSEELLSQDIDLCLLAVNAENEQKVIARNEAFTARGGRFLSLHPPSDRLLDALSPSHA